MSLKLFSVRFGLFGEQQTQSFGLQNVYFVFEAENFFNVSACRPRFFLLETQKVSKCVRSRFIATMMMMMGHVVRCVMKCARSPSGLRRLITAVHHLKNILIDNNKKTLPVH